MYRCKPWKIGLKNRMVCDTIHRIKIYEMRGSCEPVALLQNGGLYGQV